MGETKVSSVPDERRLYLTFTGPIEEASVSLLIQQLEQQLIPNQIEHLYLLLNSPGGSVAGGILFYNYLRSLPIKVTTHNIGQVDSIGTIVFLAGEERYASPATSFLFHGVNFTVGGPTAFTRGQLRERISQLEQDENRIETVVSAHTKLTKQKLGSFFRAGHSMGPKEALGCEVIHAVQEPTIPHDAQRAIISTYPKAN